jgi:hypothetical protein
MSSGFLLAEQLEGGKGKTSGLARGFTGTLLTGKTSAQSEPDTISAVAGCAVGTTLRNVNGPSSRSGSRASTWPSMTKSELALLDPVESGLTPAHEGTNST